MHVSTRQPAALVLAEVVQAKAARAVARRSSINKRQCVRLLACQSRHAHTESRAPPLNCCNLLSNCNVLLSEETDYAALVLHGRAQHCHVRIREGNFGHSPPLQMDPARTDRKRSVWCSRSETTVPVKRHRGEPEHTRDTRAHTGTRITQTNLSPHNHPNPPTHGRRSRPAQGRPLAQPLPRPLPRRPLPPRPLPPLPLPPLPSPPPAPLPLVAAATGIGQVFNSFVTPDRSETEFMITNAIYEAVRHHCRRRT